MASWVVLQQFDKSFCSKTITSLQWIARLSSFWRRFPPKIWLLLLGAALESNCGQLLPEIFEPFFNSFTRDKIWQESSSKEGISVGLQLKWCNIIQAITGQFQERLVLKLEAHCNAIKRPQNFIDITSYSECINVTRKTFRLLIIVISKQAKEEDLFYLATKQDVSRVRISWPTFPYPRNENQGDLEHQALLKWHQRLQWLWPTPCKKPYLSSLSKTRGCKIHQAEGK